MGDKLSIKVTILSSINWIAQVEVVPLAKKEGRE